MYFGKFRNIFRHDMAVLRVVRRLVGGRFISAGKVSRETFVWSVAIVIAAGVVAGDVPSEPNELKVLQVGESSELEVAEDTAETDANSTEETVDEAASETEEEVASAEDAVGYVYDANVSEIDPNAAKIQSITFSKGMGLRDALRFLSAKYQRNIVPSLAVGGQISVRHLYDVSFEEALSAILGHNFKARPEGNFIRVYTAKEYEQLMKDEDRMVNRVFTLYYISAAEAVRLVTPILSGKGYIRGSTPAETVVPTGEAISGGSSGGDSMALNDVVVIRDYPEKVKQAEELLKRLDVRPLQVLVEATILSATLSEETSLGVDWNTLNGIAVDSIGNIGAGVADGMSTTDFASSVQTSISTGGLNVGVTSDHVAALIRAIETVTDVTVLANPKILAVNKQLGQVYIGNKIGYKSQTTQTDTSTTEEVAFLETGTKLSFRPYIGGDGYIRMDIQPKDSSGKLKANDIPDESSTELATNIIVKDGQTIIIGGLFRDVINTTRRQIPLLGDLPFIGAAFRGTTDVSERQEVMVMLTPHIIEEPKETKGAARAEDIRRKRHSSKQELQWIDRARLADDRYAAAAKAYDNGKMQRALKHLEVALKLRPTYLEALRLRERILRELDSERVKNMERIILKKVERKNSEKWQRQ